MENLKTAIKPSRVGRLFCSPVTTSLKYCGGQKTQPKAPSVGVRSACFNNTNAILRSHPIRQSGAVLIVSLILLLMLTLIGMTGSQVTSMEEKMAGNSRNHNLAFQAAESALRVAEAATATIANANLYPTTQYAAQINWTNGANNPVTTYSGGTLTGIPPTNAPKFVIESLATTSGGTGGGTGNSLEAGTTGGSTSTNWYRITARGMGGTTGSVVTLQSIYKR